MLNTCEQSSRRARQFASAAPLSDRILVMESACANPKRRWRSFSLRMLLTLVTVFCVGLGWKMYRVQNLRRAVKEVQRLGGDISYIHQLSRPPEPPGPMWLRRLIGDDLFVEVGQIQLYSEQTNDETLAILARLPRIDSLIVKSDGVTDKGLTNLAKATGLKALDLRSANVTALGFVQLTGLRELETLVFRDQAFSDTWLADIARLTQVKYLILRNTQVTDDGLRHLWRAKGLRSLDLRETKVTESGVQQLRLALPDCQIDWP
jgi:hypothetical protein